MASNRKVGTVASKRKDKTRRIIWCDAYVGPVGECNRNCNGNCNDTVTGYPPISKPRLLEASASFSDASISMCDRLKQEFPENYVSRRLSSHKYAVPIDIDIDAQVKSHVGTPELKSSGHESIGDEIDKHEVVGTVDMQEIDKKHTVKKHVRSEEENRCRDDDVCLGSGSGDEGDDDDAYVPLRRVVLISLDC